MKVMPLCVLCLPLLSGAQTTQPTSIRVADAECRKCHKDIYDRYLSTPMARASGAAEENFVPGSFLHDHSNTEYTVSNKTGKPELTFLSEKDPRISGQYPLIYFLGSGHLGTTYLYRIDDYLFESPVAWYAASHGYDMKPGLEEMNQMPPPSFDPKQLPAMPYERSAAKRSGNDQSLFPRSLSPRGYYLRILPWRCAEACDQRRQGSSRESGAADPRASRFGLYQLPSRRRCLGGTLRALGPELSSRRSYFRLSGLLCLLQT